MFIIKLFKWVVTIFMFVSAIGIIGGMITLFSDAKQGETIIGCFACSFFLTLIPFVIIIVCESVVNIDKKVHHIIKLCEKSMQYQCDRLFDIEKTITEIKNG